MIRAVSLICNRDQFRTEFLEHSVFSVKCNCEILLSGLCHSKFNIFCICWLSGMGTVRLSSVPGDMVSADRGFDTDEMVGLMHAEVRIPLFTKGCSQVHAQDVDSIRELAGLYIHVERVAGIVCAK